MDDPSLWIGAVVAAVAGGLGVLFVVWRAYRRRP